MKRRNIPVIALLSLLTVSCSLSRRMERSIGKVGLSQAGNKSSQKDTVFYSAAEQVTWKD